MTKNIIQQRLEWYNCLSQQDEENALREITQEVALLALSRAGFFKKACFHGGTCLRIFYGLQRFSEDLDFALLKIDPKFQINEYLNSLEEIFKIYDYEIEIIDKSKESNVQKIFIKEDSIGQSLVLNYPKISSKPKSIKIKFEVDINPPSGADCQNAFHNFPTAFSVAAYDLPSLYAGKLHALLCRDYVKGRDWYDFLWYLMQKISINYNLLENFLFQMGPYANKEIKVNQVWLKIELIKKINSLNWKAVGEDVIRFLKPIEQESVKLWSADFFLYALKRF